MSDANEINFLNPSDDLVGAVEQLQALVQRLLHQFEALDEQMCVLDQFHQEQISILSLNKVHSGISN